MGAGHTNLTQWGENASFKVILPGLGGGRWGEAVVNYFSAEQSPMSCSNTTWNANDITLEIPLMWQKQCHEVLHSDEMAL